MEVFFFWFFGSIAAGIWAANKGRSGFGWFVFSMLLSPLLGLIFVGVLDKVPSDTETPNAPNPATHKKCPECAEQILREAKVCKHCGYRLFTSEALKG